MVHEFETHPSKKIDYLFSQSLHSIKKLFGKIRNKHKVSFRLSNSGTGMFKTNKVSIEENWWNLVPQLAQKGFDMDE